MFPFLLLKLCKFRFLSFLKSSFVCETKVLIFIFYGKVFCKFILQFLKSLNYPSFWYWLLALGEMLRYQDSKIMMDELYFSRVGNLTHSFPMLPFSTPWKHQKTFLFSDVFRGYRKAASGTNGLMHGQMQSSRGAL